jgi:predicted ATPase
MGATRVAAPVQDQYVVLDLLARLVDRSLVTSHVAKGGATTRYAMLETVRQYAYQRLTETGEAETRAAIRARRTRIAAAPRSRSRTSHTS